MSEFETIILRFRDLSTSPGGTITNHKKFIDESDESYVWWAWWNKAGEKVPAESFNYIVSKIRNEGKFGIFLFDSGQHKFYKATITDIKWNITYSRYSSPEPERTPIYYNQNAYLAWFKITSIEEIPEDNVVMQYSYCHVYDIFESGEAIFADFYNKVVFSADELQHQERTIWFVRKFRQADSKHEIKIYDSGQVRPADFPEYVISAKGDTFLWLSDLHISNNYHAFSMRDDETEHKISLLESITKELKTERIDSIAGIIITGDLTWSASKDEFEQVASFLKDAMSRFSLTNNQIFLCPGNHDIRFTDEPWKSNAPVERALNDAKENYINFYSELYNINPNNWLCSGKRIVTGSGFCLDIVLLNSSYLTQQRHVFQGHGFVGQAQREHVQNKMNWTTLNDQSPKTFRIVAMHHHLIPVLSETPKFEEVPSTAYDASALLDWFAENEINLVLHGHMHHAHQAEMIIKKQNTDAHKHPFNIISMGSSGVIADKLPEGTNNMISLITFKRKLVTIKLLRITPNTNIPIDKREVFTVDIPYEKN